MNTARLHDAIAAVCPIDSVSVGRVADKTTWKFVAKSGATASQITAGQSVIGNYDGSASADAAAFSVAERTTAVSSLTDPSHEYKLLRALMLTVLDELNAHATKMNAILTAIDGAATFAAMKTAIAAIADYPQRTANQLRTTITNKLNAGSADT